MCQGALWVKRTRAGSDVKEDKEDERPCRTFLLVHPRGYILGSHCEGWGRKKNGIIRCGECGEDRLREVRYRFRDIIQGATAVFQMRDDCLYQGCSDEDRSRIGEKRSERYYLFSWSSYN